MLPMPLPRLLTLSAALALLIPAAAPAAGRDALNPLALDPPPAASPAGVNPLWGARLYVNPPRTLAGKVAAMIRGTRPDAAQQLQVIANQPETKRYGGWDDNVANKVARYLAQADAERPGEVPLLSTYRLHHLACGRVSDSRAEVAAVARWYDAFARGIGAHRVVVFVEIDALITAPCLSQTGLSRRVTELRDALARLASLPHTVVYVDAGAADAQRPAAVARLLRRVGVRWIEGFFTNATHQDWTSREIRYGRAISRLTGGAHYVVNTTVNGRGPLIPRSRVRFGNSIHCNPPGRGLGPLPTWNVSARFPRLDGFFWIGNPGRSAGDCGHGNPPSGTFWVDYALELIRNADFRIR